MTAFEILVNGERRFIGDQVTAITLAADWVSRREADRVSLHVGIGPPEERQIHYASGDLAPGDEIVIRVLSDEDDLSASTEAPESCDFCGSDFHRLRSLVAGPQVAICDSCIAALHKVIVNGAPLPMGATIQQDDDAVCGFCQKSPPEIPGLLGRNQAAICPECLRACVDMSGGLSIG